MKFLKAMTGLAFTSLLISNVYASEFRPVSVRALGMGGSNVASTNGADATYWNPAAYAFFGEDSSNMKAADNNGSSKKAWGLGLEAAAGAYAFGPIASNVNKLEGLTAATGNVGTGLLANELQSYAALSNAFGTLDPAPGGINLQGSLFVGTRVLNYGFSARAELDLNVGVIFDNSNVGMSGQFVNAVTNNGANANLPGALAVTSANLDLAISTNLYTPSYFNVAQLQDLRTRLAQDPNYTADQAAAVVLAYDAAMAVDSSVAGQQTAMAQTLVDLSTAPGDLANNQTVIKKRGVALTEVGFTYGYAIDDKLSVGTVLKYLQVDMFVDEQLAFGATDVTSINTANRESKNGFGMDLGVMYRIPQWQFGLTVRNINKPSFKHSTGYVYELAPQAKIGGAWMPMDTVTVEGGYDLTENQGAVAGSLSQYWNVGFEWNVWKVMAMRLGAFENIAQKDIGLVQTFGLGLNLWAVRLDLAYAQSSNKVLLSGKNVPTYAQGSLALNLDF